MENEEFVEELLSKEEPEDVQKLFADNGVEISTDEVKWLGSMLEKAIDGEIDPEKILSFTKGEITEDDLSDEELGEVAGGTNFVGVVGAASAAGAGVVEAGTIAAGIITVTRSWGRVGRGVSRAARAVGRAFRRW